MTELSPAAQSVLDAFRTSHTGTGCLAAALRAAANNFRSEMTNAPASLFVRGVLASAKALEEIADEFEAQ